MESLERDESAEGGLGAGEKPSLEYESPLLLEVALYSLLDRDGNLRGSQRLIGELQETKQRGSRGVLGKQPEVRGADGRSGLSIGYAAGEIELIDPGAPVRAERAHGEEGEQR
jgi:hypothetical protein